MKIYQLVIAFTFIFFCTAIFPLTAQDLSPKILYESARVEYEAGRYKEALKMSEEALGKINPQSIYYMNVNYLMPVCLLEVSKINFDAQNYTEALGGFQRILKEYPDSGYTKDSLLLSGHCYHLLKKRDKAYSAYCKYLTKYGKYGLQPIDYFYIGQNFRILEHKREAFWYLKQAAKYTAKDAPLSNEINIEMRRCFITLFQAQPFGSICKIAATDKDIWILRTMASPEFLNSLSRYNKAEKRWTIYDYNDGYVLTKSTSMVIDGANVWIGTDDSGLIKYDSAKDTWRYYTVKDGLAENNILGLAKDGDILWIGGKRTITKFDLRNNTFEKFVLPVGSDFASSLAVNDKYVWIADESYDSKPLVELNKDAKDDTGRWIVIPNEKLKARHISALALDGKYLWIGTDDGIRRYDTETQECSSMDNKSLGIAGGVESIVATKDFVWFSAQGGWGLVYYNKTEQSWGVRLEYQTTNSLAVDGKNLLMNLKGTNEVGRFNFDTGEWTEGIQAQFISSNGVFDILVDGKYVWIATTKGIDRFNKRNLTWDHFTKANGLAGDSVGSLVSYDNEILSGVWKHGTFSFDRKNSKFVPFPPVMEQNRGYLIPLLTDGKTIWFQVLDNQTYLGLKTYDVPTGEWTSFSTASGLLHNRIYSMAADNKFVWIGTMSGVNRYNKNLHKLETFLEAKGANYEGENLIYALRPDGNEIWIYVRNKGLFKYDKKTGKGKLYFEEKHPVPGASDCWFENIQLNDRYLYLASNKGLIIYDKNKNKWFSFNFEEFLGWVWLNNIRIDGDFLWLGSRFWGLARFDKKLWLEYKEIFP